MSQALSHPSAAALMSTQHFVFEAASCLHLIGKEYQARKLSLAFPFLAPAQLQQFIDQLPERDENTILRAFITWIRKNGWTK